MTYEKEFEIFSTNVNAAARFFYYHSLIRQSATDYPLYLEALNKNERFWKDYNYSSTLSFIIILGRVFDKPKNSHKIERLIAEAKKSGLFTNDELRKRKMKGSDNHAEWIDSYMQDAYELNDKDWEVMETFVSETRKLWDDISDIRHKIFAHQQVLDDSKSLEITQKGKYDNIQTIIQRLLTFENVLWQAFHNGEKPDFEFINTRKENDAKKEIESLFGCLISKK